MKEENQDMRERTTEFALRIIRMFSSLPKTTEARVMGRQVLRSGTSVGANYREAHRARSKAEFISCAGISLREVEETAYWLELLVRSETVAGNLLAPLRQECNELTAILITIIKNAKAGREKGE